MQLLVEMHATMFILRSNITSLGLHPGKINKCPFFIVFIPIFFVLHGFLYYFGFIPAMEAILLALYYCLASIVLQLIVRLLYRRNKQKAVLVTAYLLMVYFFFGAYRDFFEHHLPLLSHYSVLALMILILLALIIWSVNKVNSVATMVMLLNLLFFVYIVIDGIMLTVNFIHPPANKFAVAPASGSGYKPLVQSRRPNIYFLVFDEYASSLALRENYGYHNDIDAYFEQKGFRVQKESYSNYHFTPASIASILNMSYVTGLYDSSVLSAKDMNYCFGLIKYNEVCKFLAAQGYEIINCSHFNLQNNPVPANDPILPVKTRLITDNTLYSKISRDVIGDIGWSQLAKYLPWMKTKSADDNQQFLEMIKAQSRKKMSHPVFVFGHLYMPHFPYFYDKNNQARTAASIGTDYIEPAPRYLEYLTHVNIEMKKLIDSIQQNTNHEAAIIVMGDHGLREHYIDKNLRRNFQNLNAVYLPGRDYHLFYDSISGVNQFKIVFNSLFNQSIPLLKDSTIFLKEQ